MYHCTLLWGEQIGHGCTEEKAMFIPFQPLRELRVTNTTNYQTNVTRRHFAFAPYLAVICVGEEHKVAAAANWDSFLLP